MLIDSPLPPAAWPSLSELAARLGLALTTLSRQLRGRGARLIPRGREIAVSPDDAVAVLEARGLTAALARQQVEEIVIVRVETVPALRDALARDAGQKGLELESQQAVGERLFGRSEVRRGQLFAEVTRPHRGSLGLPGAEGRRAPSREELDRMLEGKSLPLEEVIYGH